MVWCEVHDEGGDPGLLHHADWLASLLHGRRTCSDWHNAARLGFDAAAGAYPAWLLKQVVPVPSIHATLPARWRLTFVTMNLG